MLADDASIADIGCDHALLPCVLLRDRRAERAVGIDASPRALEAAQRNRAAFGVQDRLDLRQGWGGSPLEPREVDAWVLAGMGARTMLRVLEHADITCVVVQPNRGAHRLRKEMCARGWRITDERLALQGQRVFPCIRLERGFMRLSPLEAYLGPRLLQARPPGFAQYAQAASRHLHRLGDPLAREIEIACATEGRG